MGGGGWVGGRGLTRNEFSFIYRHFSAEKQINEKLEPSTGILNEAKMTPNMIFISQGVLPIVHYPRLCDEEVNHQVGTLEQTEKKKRKRRKTQLLKKKKKDGKGNVTVHEITRGHYSSPCWPFFGVSVSVFSLHFCETSQHLYRRQKGRRPQ